LSLITCSVALGDLDLTRPILDGVVEVQGVDLVPMSFRSPERHRRMILNREFDVCELSLGSFAALVSRGDDGMVGLPIFPHRRFRHSSLYVSSDGGLTAASQLVGEHVGIRTWQTTAGVWMRGILAEQHGLPLAAATWIAQDPDDVALDLPAGLKVRRAPAGSTVLDLCLRGEIAAVLWPEIPAAAQTGDGRLRPLFEDPRAEEERYFSETRCFPIMHLVVIRRDLLERHPWLAQNLASAFEQAKAIAMARLADGRSISLAWLQADLERQRQLLGPDPWAYGVEANREVLATFLRYAEEQGITTHGLGVDELFASFPWD
jgi:4,5-dihydroxyphthalate decarboxylase